MRDIGRIEKRVENIEYYTQLSLLESEAQNMQIQDADGFDRFKNGIIVDNFTGHGIADVTDDDYSVSMDMGQGELRPAFSQDIIALKEINSDLTTTITEQLRSDSGYFSSGDLLTLPFDAISYRNQPYASTTVNLNPYEVVPYVGRIELNPPMDEWMDTRKQPDLVVDIPGSYDTLTNLASEGVLDLNMGTVWNGWNDFWAGSVEEVNRQVDVSVSGRTVTNITTINTEQRVKQRRAGIRTALVPNTIKSQLGDRVTSIGFIPYIRAKNIEFTATGLKPNARFYAFFDSIAVSDYVTPTGSSIGAALTSDGTGTCTGTFSIPSPTGSGLSNDIITGPRIIDPGGHQIFHHAVPANATSATPVYSQPIGSKLRRLPENGKNPRWRTGTRPFRLTTNSVNSIRGDVFSSAETDYVAKGLMNTIQGTILSTREPKIQRTSTDQEKEILRNDSSTESYTTQLETPGGGAGSGVGSNQGGREDGKNDWETYTIEWVAVGNTGILKEVKKTHDKDLLVTNTTDTGRFSNDTDQTHGWSGETYKGGGQDSARDRREKEARDKRTSDNSGKDPQEYSFNTGQSQSIGGGGGGNSSHHDPCPYPWSIMDPIAQSFKIGTKNGVFVTSIDVFFSSKSATAPVTMQLRTMYQGHPTMKIIPFGEVTVNAADINTSTDATVATTFKFPSPVFLQDATEYAFVMPCSTTDHTIYTARMGQKTLDGSRLISKQPTLGSMFKSQNQSTWNAEQNEDVKFDLKVATFQETTYGTITLVNEDVPSQPLKQNPLTTTASSGVITVHCPNHGMHSTSANVTIADLAAGTYNGIASTNINGTYTSIGNIKLDSFTITAQNSDTASASGDVGGTTVNTTRNILFDVIHPVIGALKMPNTQLNIRMRTTGGRTLEGSETEYSLVTSSKSVPVIINQDQYLTAPSMIASSINETNEMSGSKSFVMTIEMFTQQENMSPVIDLKRLSAILIQNRLNNPVSGTTPDFVEETTNTGGSAAAKYMTRPVQLSNPSTALDIRISANVRSTSAVKMYYRVSSAEDARKLGDVVWTAFNSDGTPDTTVPPTENNFEFKEHQYSATDIPAFDVFQLKTVLTGTNSSYPPLIKDMRGIALAI